MNRKAYTITCDIDAEVPFEGHRQSHHCKICNISETMQDTVVTTDHY